MKKLVLMLGLLLFASQPGLLNAEEQNPRNPLNGIEKSSPENWSSGKLIWESGKIAVLTESRLLTDSDVGYPLDEKVRFYNRNGSRLNRHSFRKGDSVKFVLSADRRTIVMLVRTY